MNKYLPDKFKVAIGGYMGNSYSVELRNKKLIYNKNDTYNKNNKKSVLKPDREAWEKFWKILKEIDIWKWNRSYKPENDILDGTSWKIDIKYGDKEILSSGTNAYPPYSKIEVSEEFSRFCNAVSELLGGSEFR